MIEMEQRLQGGDVALEPLPTTTRTFRRRRSPTSPTRAEGPAEIFEREQTESLQEPRASRRRCGSLDERSRRIIQARWLAESDPKTLHELADEFGVSAERIRQIEAKAMQKMKEQLAALA